MAETVRHGDLSADAGASPYVSSSSPEAGWDWKHHLRELPKYSPIVRQESQQVGLSFGELRIWVVSNIDAGSLAYNVPLAWRVTGVVDVDAFTWSLNQVVSRHEALRTCYRQAGDEIQPCLSEDVLEVVTADLRRFEE